MLKQVGTSASRRVRVGLVYAALVLAGASLVYGQEKPAAADAGKGSVPAEAGARDFRFEVASIRPVGPPTGREYPSGVIPAAYTPGRYRQEKTSLASLAYEAFGIKHGYQTEYPGWMATTYFTLNATLPEGATKADVPIMMQHLLDDRFALRFHHETRKLAGYELVVAKSGPKLARSAGPAPDKSTVSGPTIEVKNGVPQFSKDARSGQLYSGTTAWWRGRNKTMQNLASDLSDRLRVPVTDATGLEGEYDYALTYTPGDEMYAPGSAPPASADGASTPLEHPLLREALQEQLGLKLQPIRDIPVDVVVLDGAKKVPTED